MWAEPTVPLCHCPSVLSRDLEEQYSWKSRFAVREVQCDCPADASELGRRKSDDRADSMFPGSFAFFLFRACQHSHHAGKVAKVRKDVVRPAVSQLPD